MASRPIKVALDLSCLMPQPLTGVGYYTLNLVRALIARGGPWQLHLLAASAQPAPDYLHDLARACAGSRIVRWPTRLKNLMWTRFEWPPIEWFTGPVDIAHGAFHLLPATRKAARVATVFDLSGLRYPEMYRSAIPQMHISLIRDAISKADALIAISESGKADLIDLLDAPANRVHVVYGGVNIEEFGGEFDEEARTAVARRYGIEGEYFIHVGTLEPRKNLVRLLEAYARARTRFRDFPRLVLAGHTGWLYEPIFEAIRRLGLADAVIHTGYLARADAVLLLRGSYACLYPSLYEGFGLPVLEAMAARTPVLTSNVSSLPEVVGDTGILVSPDSIDALEAGLVDLIQRREEALGRLQAAYDRALGFTWAHSAQALAGVYGMLHRESGS